MSKFELNLTCPYCNRTIKHHGLQFYEEDIVIVTCWKDEEGCGKEFQIKPIIESWVYLDKFGFPSKKVE